MNSRKCVEGFGTHYLDIWLAFCTDSYSYPWGVRNGPYLVGNALKHLAFIPISSKFSSLAWIKVDSFSLKTCQQVVPQNGSYPVMRSQGGVLSIRTVLNKSL